MVLVERQAHSAADLARTMFAIGKFVTFDAIAEVDTHIEEAREHFEFLREFLEDKAKSLPQKDTTSSPCSSSSPSASTSSSSSFRMVDDETQRQTTAVPSASSFTSAQSSSGTISSSNAFGNQHHLLVSIFGAMTIEALLQKVSTDEAKLTTLEVQVARLVLERSESDQNSRPSSPSSSSASASSASFSSQRSSSSSSASASTSSSSSTSASASSSSSPSRPSEEKKEPSSEGEEITFLEMNEIQNRILRSWECPKFDRTSARGFTFNGIRVPCTCGMCERTILPMIVCSAGIYLRNDSERAIGVFENLRRAVRNVNDDPTNMKKRLLALGTKWYQENVASVPGSCGLLNQIGFVQGRDPSDGRTKLYLSDERKVSPRFTAGKALLDYVVGQLSSDPRWKSRDLLWFVVQVRTILSAMFC